MATDVTFRGTCVLVTCTDLTCTITPTQIGQAYATWLVSVDAADVDRVEEDDYLDRIMEDVAVELLWRDDDEPDCVSVDHVSGRRVFLVGNRSDSLRQLAQGTPVVWPRTTS